MKVYHSRQSDEWTTPRELVRALEREFGPFMLDAAATAETTVAPRWFDMDRDALHIRLWQGPGEGPVWLNPPYSRVGEFIAKAHEQSKLGATIVCLVPSRTDTRWWHDHVWDDTLHRPYTGVEVRFIKGRLKFGNATAGAPFPSCVIVFRP